MQFHSSAVGQHATITNNCNDNDNGRNYEEAFASKENVDNEIIKRWIDKASRKRKLDEMLIIMNANASSKRSLDDTNLGKITGFFLDILEELKETKKGDKKKVLKLTMDENEYMLKF
ncbi:24213_t:CDS:2 [Entrophospora sp. SA101]|nr:24213_t:CDS:2 [Entrophospora sp. SA101]